MKLSPTPAPAQGTRTTLAFVDRWDEKTDQLVGGVEEVQLAVYPPAPRGERLRARRLELHLGLREACPKLGLTAVQLSGLERGSLLLTEAEWDHLFETLEGGTP